jgi:hypothetical protein
MISPAARQLEAKPAPHLTLVQAPRRQAIITYAQPCVNSWQSATADYRKLYSQDGRWVGGFVLWTLEIYGDWGRRLKRRQGHWDANTGIFYYSGPKDISYFSRLSSPLDRRQKSSSRRTMSSSPR